MRVSKDFWSKGPAPLEIKLFVRKLPLFGSVTVGAGNKARMLPTFCWIMEMGIMLLVKAVRPEPSTLLPVVGLKTCPVPAPKELRYWLKSQKPGVALAAFVAGLQVLMTSAVGMVYWCVMPCCCLVPW